MQCIKCNSDRVLVEGLQGGTRRTCQECGHVEVVNDQGRRMLTDDRGREPTVKQLLG